MRGLKVVSVIVAIISLLAGTGGIASAQSGTETRITYQTDDQFDPSISGNIIVYTDRRMLDADIYYYDIATGLEVQVTSGGGDQMLTDISGSRIVYTDFGTGNADICLYDITTGTTTRLTDNPANQRRPAICGDYVVWEDDRDGDFDIYLLDLNTFTETCITDAPGIQRKPDVNGTRVVWEDYSSGDMDIYMMDLVTSEVSLILGGSADELEPAIDGDIVAFTSNSYSVGDVYYYRISTHQTYAITATEAYERNPDISGDYIIYESYASGDANIWLYRISRGVSEQVTTDPAEQYLHHLSGYRLAFTDNRNSNLDIYIYEFTDFGPDPDIDVSPLNYSFGDVTAGSTASTIITINNTGEFNLSVTDVGSVGSPFWYKVSWGLDNIPPGEARDIYMYYSPHFPGLSTATLQIFSNDPDEAIVEVYLSGNCVLNDDPAEQIAEILEFFDDSVAEGSLVGNGPGGSAEHRLNALRNMIEAAGDLIENGLYEEALQQLRDAYERVDGLPRPPDFATGEAAAELASLVMQLIESLE